MSFLIPEMDIIIPFSLGMVKIVAGRKEARFVTSEVLITYCRPYGLKWFLCDVLERVFICSSKEVFHRAKCFAFKDCLKFQITLILNIFLLGIFCTFPWSKGI